jgi:hypothetical protein
VGSIAGPGVLDKIKTDCLSRDSNPGTPSSQHGRYRLRQPGFMPFGSTRECIVNYLYYLNYYNVVTLECCSETRIPTYPKPKFPDKHVF